MSMFATVRRHLRRIRYYSATRERSGWHRAADAALIITFAMSFVLTSFVHFAVQWSQQTLTLHARLYRQADGQLGIEFIERGTIAPWTQARPIGEVTLHADDVHSGWPMPTRSYKSAFRMDLNRFREIGTRENLSLAEEPEIAGAIRKALEDDQPEAAARLETAEAQAFWRGWVANFAMWWIMLYVLSMILIGGVRLTVFVHCRRRDSRAYRLQRKGLCIHCGYDVRGLEFRERCPECGELI